MDSNCRKLFQVSFLDVGLWNSSYLEFFLKEKVSVFGCSKKSLRLGWGLRRSGRRAKDSGQDFVLLEDGFLRSLDLGANKAIPFSLVFDDLGIYYDSTNPSRLENLILDSKATPDVLKALELIKKYKLSKYNHAPSRQLPVINKPRVLVIDQTLNDVSVKLGGADEKVFNEMLQTALKENPQAEVLVKTHPDVLAGKKRGYLTEVPKDPRIKLYAEDISPLSLLEQVDKVYVVTSQMGFEALMLKKPVVCFGLPWYAGWGLTDDKHPEISKIKERRNKSRTLEELFSAAYFDYPRYLNPITKKRGTIFDVIDYLARNKAANDETRGNVYCIGMSLWKRAIVKPFLSSPSTKVHFVSSENKVPKGAQAISWGVKNSNPSHWRMEDGFLRSVGLGSDLFRPVSLVLDKNGMYYDPHSKSDLETMIQTQEVGEEELSRAKAFKKKYISMKMSKYNLGRADFQVDSKEKKVILVPGQVEDDASILRGSPIVRTNQALLELVRKNNPDSFIIYKPHPDVVAGNRKGHLTDPRFADAVVVEANIIDCIQLCDELHTMTSLSGFEALLHGKVVHCYGGPFYAGWGLTKDHYALPHRSRKVSLDELVLAAYLKYPRYILPGVKGLVSAEDALNWLSEQSKISQPKGWLARKTRKIRALYNLFFT